MLALLLSLIGGALAATGFAPLGWWPATLAGLALLIALVARAPSRRRAFALGWAWGVGHFSIGLNWIAGAFEYQDAMPVWLGWGAVVALSLYLAVYIGAAALAAWAFRRRSAAYALAWGAAWIVTEWLRATLFTGFAWNPLAAITTARIDALTGLGHLSVLIGTYGVSGLIVLLAAGWMRGAEDAGVRRWTRALPLLTLLPLALLAVPPLTSDAGRTALLVRVVQPNINQHDKYEDEANFAKLAALSGQAGAAPRLLLWPEAAVEWYLEYQRGNRGRIAALLGPRDTLLLGGTSLAFGANGRVEAVRNSFFALTPDNRLRARYDKAHLVPYGEYLPMRPILSAIGLSRLVPGDLDFLAGPGPVTLDVPGFGRVGGQICYEIIFSGQVLDAGNRPDFMFNPSNDAWFGVWGPPQHLAQARLRALEEGVPVVRSTPTGISAVIDARGRVPVALPLGRAGFIEAAVPAAASPTPFARLGNLAPLLLALLLASGAVALLRRAR